jgi:hypothetical protein
LTTVVDRLSALTPEQRALFEALRRKQQTAGPPSPPPVLRVTSSNWEGAAAGDWPLSIDQERLWRLHRDNPRLVSWNVDAASRLRGDLDVAILEGALQEIVRRHAVLRASFPLIDGRPVQRVAERIVVPWALIDLSALPAGQREAEGCGSSSTGRGRSSTWIAAPWCGRPWSASTRETISAC